MENPVLGVVVVVAAALTGCAGAQGSEDVRASTPTVSVTATVTETVTVQPAPVLGETTSADVPPPELELEVYRDGCGVIRSEAEPGVGYDNLTWSIMDEGGFQVLGRLAETETRYRYYLGGRYTVVLEAFWGGGYRPVSNEVTINC